MRSYLNEKSSGSRSRKQRLTAGGTRCADHVTPLYPQKLALTSPTGGGRSVGIVRVRTKATEFSFVCFVLPPFSRHKHYYLSTRLHSNVSLKMVFFIVTAVTTLHLTCCNNAYHNAIVKYLTLPFHNSITCVRCKYRSVKLSCKDN